MREVESIGKDPSESVKIAPIKTESKLLGTMYPNPGHSIFQMNMNTLLVSKVPDEEFESYVAISFDKEGWPIESKKRKLVGKPGHLYCGALNKKNAMKRFAKMLQNNSTIVTDEHLRAEKEEKEHSQNQQQQTGGDTN